MPQPISRPIVLAAAGALIAACATTATPPSRGASPAAAESAPAPGHGSLPPIPARTGPLAIDLVYPDPGTHLSVSDSNFVFGNVGTGGARLTIDGTPVDVAPNGAFLAFLPIPPNGEYRLVADAGTQHAELSRTVVLPSQQQVATPDGALRIDASSLSPGGAMTVAEGERVTVRFRGTPGAAARLVFPDGSSVPLIERAAVEREEGFQQDVAIRPRTVAEYSGSFLARAPLAGRATPALAPIPAGTRGATVELARGADTLRAPLDLSLAVARAGDVRVGMAVPTREDSLVIGQALPGAGTPYQWFFPAGTVFTVTGESQGYDRVRLTDDLSLWIDARTLRLLPAGAAPPEGTVSTVRADPQPEWVDFRLSTSDRLPYRVTADGNAVTVEVYGARTRTNWAHYGPEDAFVRRVSWEQPRSDLFAARLETAEPIWGWKSFYDAGGTLVIRVRRPPRIDREHPLAGRLIAVDAGHPPGGAIGPTRLTEADANLMVAKHLVRLLREAGARVIETRPDTAAVALNLRNVIAERANAELAVSLHNNAFPDGVNPFANNGTAAFYNAPQSMELARGVKNELIGELGTRDLGIARADLALVRDTWFPSMLSETMFLMVPQQEAALRNPDVQERIARAHLRAIEAFLRSRAR